MRQPAGHRALAASVVCALALVSSVLGQGSPYPNARTGGNYMHNYYLPPAPSSTPWAPAWSPDGRWIAVAMSGSIWKVDPASGVAHENHLRRRNTTRCPSGRPTGTGSSTRPTMAERRMQLGIVNVATGEARALTNDSFVYTDPVFSPDGTRVAYVSTKPNGFFNVYIRPIKDGQWAGDEVAVSTRQQVPQFASVLRHRGRAHHSRLDARWQAACCSSRIAACRWVGQHLAACRRRPAE